MTQKKFHSATLQFLQQHPDISILEKSLEFDQFDKCAKKHISCNLLTYRRILGLSQDGLAKLLNVSRSQYRKYESGDETIRLDVGMRLSLKCGLPIFHLLQNSNYDPYLELPQKNEALDRIWFYGNSVTDDVFIKLCKTLAIFLNKADMPIDYQPVNLCSEDFDKAIDENENEIYSAIGEGILAVRHHFKYSQEQVANLMGISVATYQEYEKGNQRPRFNLLMSARWVISLGVHAFVPLAGTQYAKIRLMQNQRIELLLSILEGCSNEQLDALTPLIEGFYQSIRHQSEALMFEL